MPLNGSQTFWAEAEQVRFRGVTLVTLLAVGLLARVGSAQTSRPTSSAAAVETIIRRPAADPNATTRPAAAKSSPLTFDSTRVALSLAIVLVLIFALRWLGKRMFGRTILGRSSRAVQVVSRNVISPKQQLLVLQVGRRLVVVGDSGQQMNPLCEITDPEEMAALLGQIQEEKRDSLSNGFSSLFGRAGSDFEKNDEPARSIGVSAEDDSPDESNRGAGGPSDAQGTRDELHGLMDKVRLMSRQFRRT